MNSKYLFYCVFFLFLIAPSLSRNYDVIKEPMNISVEAKKGIPFYKFIDEETEMYMKNANLLDSSKNVGLCRIIVIHNVPYADAWHNGKGELLTLIFLLTSNYIKSLIYNNNNIIDPLHEDSTKFYVCC